MREIRVHFGSNDRDRPELKSGETLTVDVVYRAPEEIGTYEHGGYARTVYRGGGGAREIGVQTGGQPIEVEERPIIPESPVDEPGEEPGDGGFWGSVDWGSLNSGSSN